MQFNKWSSLLLLLTGVPLTSAFIQKSTLLNGYKRINENNTPLYSVAFEPPDTINTYEISEPACAEAASKIRRINVPVSGSISPDGEAGISYIHWPATNATGELKQTNTLPLLLVHGFDSSCLEFRRLGPELAALGISTYAVDLLGWGFTQYNAISDFSANAKIEALQSFWKVVGNNEPVCIGGASLGGAAAIEFASAPESPAKAAIMIDAQGFTDGIGPPSLLPPFLARLVSRNGYGVKVLKSEGLRNSANQMSYFDKDTFATEDALKTGRIHCFQEGWEEAQLSFIKSGGFYPSKKVKNVSQKTLVLWGREDGILDGKTYAPQFMENLPDAELRWIEKCGHVPHLEQGKETAAIMKEFLESESLLVKDEKRGIGTQSVIGIAGAVAAAAAATGAAVVINKSME